MGGGNSFLLIQELHRLGIVKAIRESVKNGMPYVGVSAGSNVACPTMMTTNDMPIVLPETFDSLGIVPFQINPHYYPGKITFTHQGDQHPHYGESRAQRISEYHMLHDTPVLGMWEGVVCALGRGAGETHWNRRGLLPRQRESRPPGRSCIRQGAQPPAIIRLRRR